MIGSFKQYLVEEAKEAFFTFGRMNPPTIGHEKLMDVLSQKAGKNPFFIFISHTQDSKKNPLDYDTKIKALRKMFPRYARQIIKSDRRTALDVASYLYDQGYNKITMVIGQDRFNEMKALLPKYNGVKGRHGFYNFEKINFINAGNRDGDSDGVEGMSSSKMREYAKNNDFVKFAQGLPDSFSNKDSKDLFNAVRKGLGLKEEKDFRNHIRLEPVSPIRESYVDGKLFEVGDEVVIKENGEIGKIKRLGSNYVIIESKSNTYRKWIDSVEKIEDPQLEYEIAPFSQTLTEKVLDWGTPEATKKAKKMTPGQEVEEKIEVAQDKDIDHRKGSQPASYQKGIKSKSTKVKRDAHFKKMSKRDDHKNPDLYKPAPGDATAKTKPSQYTLKFKKMYGEEIQDPVKIARQRIEREKQSDEKRHDRMMDRARTRATKIKNRETNG